MLGTLDWVSGPRIWLDLATTHVIYPRDLFTKSDPQVSYLENGEGWAIDLHSKLLRFYIPLLRHFLGGKRKNGELLSRPPFGELNLNLLFILNSWVSILGTTQAEFFGDLLVFSLAECKLTEHRLWSFCAGCRVFSTQSVPGSEQKFSKSLLTE